MKKACLIAIAFTAMTSGVFGQTKEKIITIQTNPVLLVIDFFSFDIYDNFESLFLIDLETQFKINNTFNLALDASFLVSDQNFIAEYSYETFERRNLQVTLKPVLIIRPLKTGLEGFYVGLFPSIGWTSTTDNMPDSENRWFTEAGFGFNIGYKWIFRGGFTFQVGSGLGKTFSIPQKPGPREDVSLNSDGRTSFGTSDLYFFDCKMGYSF
ncbi:MAG: hypothetical protein LBD48_03500 [Treponema sp.]|jgi:hypothetical protein|nr:hypothetical protein [Treponema sp.]